ncbi:MAG: hypothetical protein ACKOXW_00010 [Actinomycetes bacterium]
MVLSVYERRRIGALSVLTLFALTIFSFAAGGASSTSSTTTTTVPPVVENEIPESVILGGPPPLAPTGSAPVAYPATSPNSLTGRATYTAFGYSSNPVCFSAMTPVGVQLTVTNINNGRTIKCTSAFGVSVPAGISVQLHSTQFTQLADLVDAPIPVKITW